MEGLKSVDNSAASCNENVSLIRRHITVVRNTQYVLHYTYTVDLFLIPLLWEARHTSNFNLTNNFHELAFNPPQCGLAIVESPKSVGGQSDAE